MSLPPLSLVVILFFFSVSASGYGLQARRQLRVLGQWVVLASPLLKPLLN